MPVQQTAQRMTPIDAPRILALRLLSVFLPQLVRKQERDDQQGQDKKRAKYQVLDHDGLRIAVLQIRRYILGSLRRR
jgi:hypothetical protein